MRSYDEYNIFSAGQTTALALSWTRWYLLATNKDAEAKPMRNWIVLGGRLPAGDLPQLLHEMTSGETMRLYPPVFDRSQRRCCEMRLSSAA